MSTNLQCTMHVSLEGLSAPRLRTDTQVFVGDAAANRFSACPCLELSVAMAADGVRLLETNLN